MRSFLLLALACTPKSPPVAAPDAAEASGVEVVKSPIDARDYRYVALDNGMQALLIHDPDTDMAAASLRVHIGHYADPLDRQGLAHFLEHMLFMGTDRYPDVEDYREFINGHGGYSNAGTGGESTTYYFQVEQGFLDGAFDRFARFFVAPVLDPAYVERERKAVHNEYSLKIKQEDRRTRQVRKITTNPEHPEAKFSVGNQDTLGDRDADVVYEDLRALYEANYRADRMTVSVIGRQSLDELEAMVREDLSEVPGGAVAKPERPAPFLPEQLGVRIELEPVEERREVELQFPLPPQSLHWPQQPHSYLSGLIGDEAEGTLAARLKEAGYSEWMSASLDGADDYDLFKINVGLTEDGAAHVDDVVAAVFETLRLVESEGVSAERYDQLSTKAALDFAWAEEARPVDAVRTPVWNLGYHPPEHALDARYQWGSYDPVPIREALGRMVPANLRLVVVLPEVQTDQTEALYDVPYSIRPLTEAELSTYAAADSPLDIAMPALNPYLPQDTSIIDAPDPGIPERLTEVGDALELWHLADASFGVPRAAVQLDLFTPSPDVQDQLVARLYAAMLSDHLLPFTYPVGQAGLSLSASAGRAGVSVRLSGYDDRMADVLGDALDRIKAYEPEADRLEIQRARLVRSWRNQAFDRPSSQAYQATSSDLDANGWEAQAQADALEAIDLAAVKAYAARLKGPLGAQMMAHGNLTADEARAMGEAVRERFELTTPGSDLIGVYDIPAGVEVVRDLTIDHNDSSIVITYLGDHREDPFVARWSLLAEILKTPFFGQLRTEQQLGYLVRASKTSHDVWPGMTFAIQSSTTDPFTLQERIDAFLAEQPAALEAMSDEDFIAIRDGLVAKLREDETRLFDRTRDLAFDLYERRLSFDREEALAKHVESISKADILDFLNTALLADDAGRLVVRNVGTAHAGQGKGAPGCGDRACVVEALGDVRNRERR